VSFQDDLDTDRSAVFLDATNGFASTVTYVQRDGTSLGSITVVEIEQIFAIFDNKQSKLFHVSAATVTAPNRGDRLTTAAGETFQVADVQAVDGMWELRCARMQDTQ
jgi:hypothetical protein